MRNVRQRLNDRPRLAPSEGSGARSAADNATLLIRWKCKIFFTSGLLPIYRVIYIIYLSKLWNYNFSPGIEYKYYYYDDYEKGDHEEYYHHYEDAVHEDSDSSDIDYDYYYNDDPNIY